MGKNHLHHRFRGGDLSFNRVFPLVCAAKGKILVIVTKLSGRKEELFLVTL